MSMKTVALTRVFTVHDTHAAQNWKQQEPTGRTSWVEPSSHIGDSWGNEESKVFVQPSVENVKADLSIQLI